jgi:hypothetical protein
MADAAKKKPRAGRGPILGSLFRPGGNSFPCRVPGRFENPFHYAYFHFCTRGASLAGFHITGEQVRTGLFPDPTYAGADNNPFPAMGRGKIPRSSNAPIGYYRRL